MDNHVDDILLIFLAVANLVAVDALPDNAPENVVAVNLPAVVSRYTPVSATAVTPVAVDVGVVEVPNKYALVVVAKVVFT